MSSPKSITSWLPTLGVGLLIGGALGYLLSTSTGLEGAASGKPIWSAVAKEVNQQPADVAPRVTPRPAISPALRTAGLTEVLGQVVGPEAFAEYNRQLCEQSYQVATRYFNAEHRNTYVVSGRVLGLSVSVGNPDFFDGMCEFILHPRGCDFALMLAVGDPYQYSDRMRQGAEPEPGDKDFPRRQALVCQLAALSMQTDFELTVESKEETVFRASAAGADRIGGVTITKQAMVDEAYFYRDRIQASQRAQR